MKDPFNLFIEDSVYASKTEYYKLMYKTKRIFFEYLNEEKTLGEFKKEIEKIWDNVDHSYMKQRIKELEDMIEARDLEDNKIINKNAKYEKFYDIAPESVFKSTEKKYKKSIEKYYKGRLKTIKKEYVDKKSYLSKTMEKYDEIQATIPYFNKNGTIRSWHNIANYNSMVYNTNLTHSGWNRTLYDTKLLGKNLLYLVAHTLACPLCMPWQGKIYSTDGTNGTIDGEKYQPKENAIEGGVGHPNCRHQWTIYWGKDQLQEETYNSKEWLEKYKNGQKIKALSLTRKKLKNDREIYKNIGNYEEVDKVNSKLKRLNSEIKELKNG